MDTTDLIPRPLVRESLIEALRTGSVLLYGPRRVGKSTLLDMFEDAPPPDTVCLRVDLEGSLERPEEQLVALLERRLGGAGLLRSSEALERLEGVQVAGTGVTLRPAAETSPWDDLERIVTEATEAVGDGVLILALDELPWWLDAVVDRQGPAAARAALAKLRRLRQARPAAEHLRLVLTGSIGLAGLASELGASAELNDLTTVTMPPMSLDEGATLFETELAGRSRPCAAVAARRAAELAGGIPYWVKRLAAACGVVGAPDTGAVQRAAESLLVPELRKLFADEGREHFRRRHRAVMPALLAMLEAVSGEDCGNPRQAALNAALGALPTLSLREAEECLYLLMDGFYLRTGPGDTLDWVNPLFRRWWLRYGGP